MLLSILPIYTLTAIALCHTSHRSPASFWEQGFAQTELHLRRWDKDRMPCHLSSTGSGITCLSLSKSLPNFTLYSMNGTTSFFQIWVPAPLSLQFQLGGHRGKLIFFPQSLVLVTQKKVPKLTYINCRRLLGSVEREPWITFILIA